MSMMYQILKQCSPEELKTLGEGEDADKMLHDEVDKKNAKAKKMVALRSKI